MESSKNFGHNNSNWYEQCVQELGRGGSSAGIDGGMHI